MYEWDEEKRRRNLKKHGVDFAIVEDFDWETSIASEDPGRGYGEARYVSIGPIGSKVYVLVWCERGEESLRVISLREADRHERKRHAEETAKATRH